ncbi:MAG: VanZ family protein [Granulosicoccus sp.]
MKFDFGTKGMLSMQHLTYKRVWIALGFLMLATVVYASLTSVPHVFRTIMLHDKLAHSAAYASLMVLFAQLFRHDLTRLLLVIGLILFGFAMEYFQGMVPYRRFDYLDMLANSVGVILAWGLAYTWFGDLVVKAEQLYDRLNSMGSLSVQST